MCRTRRAMDIALLGCSFLMSSLWAIDLILSGLLKSFNHLKVNSNMCMGNLLQSRKQQNKYNIKSTGS